MGYLLQYFKVSQKNIAVISFSLFFAWILILPFEGQVLYVLTEGALVEPSEYIFVAILAHFMGLFSCGFLIKNQLSAKIMMITSILICISGSLVFFMPFSILWYISLIIIAYIAGLFVASVGFYIKNYSNSAERYKIPADVLINSNILMLIVNVITVNVSAILGLVFSILILVIALFVSFKLENKPDKSAVIFKTPAEGNMPLPSIMKPFFVLCIFITIITINSGLMYQVVTPAFSHMEVLTSYYWAVPYILALFILRNLSTKNNAYILYAAMAMIGLSYIAFMGLPVTASSYLIIDTLMLGAFGVCDLFWWSILVSFFDYSDNPAQILGIGLSMNVLGILIGGFVGNRFLFAIGNHTSTSLVALTIIFIVLMMLPLLNIQLTKVFNSHIFLVKFAKMKEIEQEQVVEDITYQDKLTEKEKEVVKLLLKGYTYKGIAEQLFITENTMKYHIKNIYQKLNINSKMELVKLFSKIQ